MKGICLVIIFIIVGTIFVILLFNSKVQYIDSRVNNSNWALQQLNYKFKYDSLTSEIKDSLETIIINQKIEQESYMQMINRESDRVILYVSILFAAFGLIGFGYFTNEFKIAKLEFDHEIIRIETDYKNRIIEVKTEIETNTKSEIENFRDDNENFKNDIAEQNTKISSLEYDSNLAIGNINALIAESEVKNIYEYPYFMIQYCLYTSLALEIKHNDELLEINRGLLKKVILKLNEVKDKYEFRKLKEASSYRSNEIFSALTKIAKRDIEVILLCAKIISKFEELIPGIFLKNELDNKDL